MKDTGHGQGSHDIGSQEWSYRGGYPEGYRGSTNLWNGNLFVDMSTLSDIFEKTNNEFTNPNPKSKKKK